MIKDYPLVNTLLHLKGNPRACVLTEPLWGIPFNLYIPYFSMYMYALGLTESQIGLIASIGMAFQIFFSMFSGIITDKLGRKKTTFVYDFVAWSIPCVIWAFSSSFYLFALAAVINSVLKVTQNSWGCLLVEDADKEQIVNIFAWIYISGMLAAFFAPITGVFIGRFRLVPTMRVIFLISFVMMTAKFIILNMFATETEQGKIRMQETKHLSMFQQLGGYRAVLGELLKAPETLLTLGIMLVIGIVTMVNSTFWAINATQRIHITEESVGIFPFIKSSLMLLFFFTVLPKIKAIRFKKPMVVGFSTFIVSQLILVLTPEKGYAFLAASVLLEACSLSLVSPLLDSMLAILVNAQERARLMALMYVAVMLLSSPFGWIAGILSGLDRRLPFVMNALLLAAGIILTVSASSAAKRKAAEAAS